MSRVVEDETKRDLYARRFTHREDQKRWNLDRVKEAKRLLQDGSADRR